MKDMGLNVIMHFFSFLKISAVLLGTLQVPRIHSVLVGVCQPRIVTTCQSDYRHACCCLPLSPLDNS